MARLYLRSEASGLEIVDNTLRGCHACDENFSHSSPLAAVIPLVPFAKRLLT